MPARERCNTLGGEKESVSPTGAAQQKEGVSGREPNPDDARSTMVGLCGLAAQHRAGGAPEVERTPDFIETCLPR